jgi:hypothetical protein
LNRLKAAPEERQTIARARDDAELSHSAMPMVRLSRLSRDQTLERT